MSIKGPGSIYCDITILKILCSMYTVKWKKESYIRVHTAYSYFFKYVCVYWIPNST